MADKPGSSRPVVGRFTRDVIRLNAKMMVEVEGTEEQVGNILAKIALVVAAATDTDVFDDDLHTQPVDGQDPRSTQDVDPAADSG